VKSRRVHGKAGFLDLEDWTGRIQVYVKIDNIGEKGFLLFDKGIDTGDIIGVKGLIFKTKKGELSIWAEELTLLARAMRPLPSDWYGLKNVETRFRQRYLDLIMNPTVREVFQKRSRIISETRRLLDSKGFLEVETPMLNLIPGGALAKPFKTHHNQLDIDLYLRIAIELHLKRLIVGGFEKVYEIGRVFRNEGVDPERNPDFTMLELYQAYVDYNEIMRLTEEIISNAANRVLGSTKITFNNQEIDVAPPYEKISFLESIKKYAGLDVENMNRDDVLRAAEKIGVKTERIDTWGHIVEKIMDKTVQPELKKPTFLIDYPEEISPLAKRKRGNPKLTERFELVIGGMELANAFSELNDPVDQRKRFEEQENLRRKGDDEAHAMDEDYVRALEYGLPPTGGLGLGMDRLTRLLTNQPSLREVILFPVMRPETE
jgi:lysyl-tRNA synthetase, class II